MEELIDLLVAIAEKESKGHVFFTCEDRVWKVVFGRADFSPYAKSVLEGIPGSGNLREAITEAIIELANIEEKSDGYEVPLQV